MAKRKIKGLGKMSNKNMIAIGVIVLIAIAVIASFSFNGNAPSDDSNQEKSTSQLTGEGYSDIQTAQDDVAYLEESLNAIG